MQYQNDITQGLDNNAGAATLVETHMQWQKDNLGLRALYATWLLEGDGPKSVGADEQSGWYIESSYKINDLWGVFARYNEWDNTAGNSVDSKIKQSDVGMNFWPHSNVVLKADFMTQSGAGDDKGFNLGLGYHF